MSKPSKLLQTTSNTALPPEPLDPAEVVARFQLETDATIATIKREHQGQLVEQERKIARLEDAWTRTRDEVTALKRTVDDALHQMRQGLEEVLNAQRLSMAAATKAETAAAVFDKLKASQPDLHRMVRDQDKVVASVRDQMTHLAEQVGGYAKRLDELDAVAVDYEDTKGCGPWPRYRGQGLALLRAPAAPSRRTIIMSATKTKTAKKDTKTSKPAPTGKKGGKGKC
jgi:phage-related tail protein